MRIAEYARHHGIRATSRKFGVAKICISRWRNSLVPQVRAGVKRPKIKRRGQGRRISYPKELEEKLVQWVLEMRDLQIAVSSSMLKQKARILIYPVLPSFKASHGWREKFCSYLFGLPIFVYYYNYYYYMGNVGPPGRRDCSATGPQGLSGHLATWPPDHRGCQAIGLHGPHRPLG